MYSWPSLVWPNTEELISRPFVGENWFRLVLLKRMSTENAVGCLACLSHSLFLVFHSLPCPLGAQGNFARGFVPKGPIWICHHSNFGFLLYFLSDRIIERNNTKLRQWKGTQKELLWSRPTFTLFSHLNYISVQVDFYFFVWILYYCGLDEARMILCVSPVYHPHRPEWHCKSHCLLWTFSM